VALPWLDRDLQGLDAAGLARVAPSLAWLLERSTARPGEGSDWRAWLLAHVTDGPEMLHRHPAGPTREALARKSGSNGYVAHALPGRDVATWACARPVHFATGIDHLALEPSLAIPLTQTEAVEIAASLNAALSGRGWCIVPIDVERWLLACAEEIECQTSPPADAAGRELRARLPEGRDARLVRAVMNEMQMILHAHPLNEARIARGLQPVNAVWVWGFGPVREPRAVSLPRLATDDESLEELWRLHEGEVTAVSAAGFEVGAAAGDLLVAALDELPLDERLRRIETAVFLPLRSSVDARTAVDVELHSGNAVRRLEARSPRFVLRRWLGRIGKRR
jgi:hypothetical protein